jgi:hypothetical protein
MNIITILIWITIAIIAAIAIVLVKLHFRGDELEHEEGSILPSGKSINEMLNSGKNKIASQNNNNNSSKSAPRSLSPNSSNENSRNLFSRITETKSNDDAYIVPEVEITEVETRAVETNNVKNYEYESQNQVLINYDNNVKKFQEPIKQSQMDIMTQNNKDTSELKDLFTIDELIKESKRKDSEREKESQTIRKDEDDAELNEIKESIKNRTQEPLIEEVIAEEKEETISDLIKEDNEVAESEADSVATQKDIDEAISTASQEIIKDAVEEAEESGEDENITDTLLKQEEISEPTLKTPSKVGDYKLGASIDDAGMFNKEEDPMDLDYRKDLDKVKNKITGSKIFKEVKGKLNSEPEEIPLPHDDGLQDEFIRTVNEYDEYEPILNETYMDIEDGTYEDYHDQKLRQENTKRVFRMAQSSPEPEPEPEIELEPVQPKVGEIKSKPARNNVKININNNEVVLKKGDEIIFNHDGETYSSQVYAINGDDIAVRYRGKNIKIKTSDVKKIY